MKKKLSVRAAVSLLLSALLFCMPIGAFMANSGNTVDAYAEESATEERAEQRKAVPGETEGSGEAEESTETEPGMRMRRRIRRKKRRAERYREMKFQSRNVPVKKNAHSIP